MANFEEPNISVQTLRILSYNIGLLRLKLLGFEVFSNPPHIDIRLPFIVEGLKAIATEVDILCIQECYEVAHAKIIIDALISQLPYSCRMSSNASNHMSIKLHNGLLTLSRFPILSSTLHPLRKVAPLEKAMGNKSTLYVSVNVPSLGKLCIVNVHTTAGGTSHPEHPDTDADREDELTQIVEECNEIYSSGATTIIIGDLNCGPEASKGNFSYILNKGFRDTFAEYHNLDASSSNQVDSTVALNKQPLAITWDGLNYLNTIGPHAGNCGQRIDHVLVSEKGLLKDWVVSDTRILFTEEIVSIDHGRNIRCTLSDHYALLVHLRAPPPSLD